MIFIKKHRGNLNVIAITIIAIVCSLATIISCKKATTNVTITDGTYVGVFQRLISGTGNSAKVSLILKQGNWVGQSESPKYPALCNGTFKTSDANEITFFENCIWTADFDWTLVLANKFSLQVSGKTYILTKDYGNGTIDRYHLTKQ